MLEDKDQLYSTMFNALRHNIRRSIIRMLSESDLSFTDLLERLKISSSHLIYHIASLDGLVLKRGTRYRLSSSGYAAVEMMRKLENPTRVRPNYSAVFRYLTCFLFLLLTMLICVYADYHVSADIIKKGFLDAVFLTSILLYPALPLVLIREYWFTDLDASAKEYKAQYSNEFYYNIHFS
jgi:DNA-binding HxlR family transcriptional regulator